MRCDGGKARRSEAREFEGNLESEQEPFLFGIKFSRLDRSLSAFWRLRCERETGRMISGCYRRCGCGGSERGAMANATVEVTHFLFVALLGLFLVMSGAGSYEAASAPLKVTPKTNAYATVLYMGTPRDNEFYIAARIMLGTLVQLQVDADLVVIPSANVPLHWQKTL